jgi:threonine synthase
MDPLPHRTMHATALMAACYHSRRTRAGADVPDFLVLVATSGDTGKAALEGFADRESTRIAVLFPARGVSEVQRRLRSFSGTPQA